MNTITFATGESHLCSFMSFNPNEQTAYIALAEADFNTAARLFSDPEATSEMVCGAYRMIGYTECLDLSAQPYGIQAVLRGGYYEFR